MSRLNPDLVSHYQVGGATGSIGDPSGRKSERVPLSRDVLEENVAGIEKQIRQFLSRGEDYASRRGYPQSAKTPKVLNNYDWFSQMTALDFLGDIGRYARVNSMLAKERYCYSETSFNEAADFLFLDQCQDTH